MSNCAVYNIKGAVSNSELHNVNLRDIKFKNLFLTIISV